MTWWHDLPADEPFGLDNLPYGVADLPGGARAYPEPAVAAEDEELGHVARRLGGPQAALLIDDDEAGELAADPDQEGMAKRIDAERRRSVVVKAPIGAHIPAHELAEVIGVKLDQAVKDRRITCGRADKLGLHERGLSAAPGAPAMLLGARDEYGLRQPPPRVVTST